MNTNMNLDALKERIFWLSNRSLNMEFFKLARITNTATKVAFRKLAWEDRMEALVRMHIKLMSAEQVAVATAPLLPEKRPRRTKEFKNALREANAMYWAYRRLAPRP